MRGRIVRPVRIWLVSSSKSGDIRPVSAVHSQSEYFSLDFYEENQNKPMIESARRVRCASWRGFPPLPGWLHLMGYSTMRVHTLALKRTALASISTFDATLAIVFSYFRYEYFVIISPITVNLLGRYFTSPASAFH